MKTLRFVVVLVLLTGWTRAQQQVPRADTVRLAVLLNFDLDNFADTPIPTDADTKRPFALRAGDRGGMVLPETKLTAAVITAAGETVVPVGQLWLRHLAVLRDFRPVHRERLKHVTIQHEGRAVDVPLYLLGVRQLAGGVRELLIYGQAKEPLLAVPLQSVQRPHSLPLELSVLPEAGDSARITLHLAGQYEATFSVVADD